MTVTRLILVCAAIGLTHFSQTASSDENTPAAPPTNHTTASATNTAAVVVPDHFLRAWDPVTVFFDRPQTPQAGPEDHPKNFITLSPAHPGSFTWLDTQTLQFRPAEAWPPLSHFTWTTAHGDTTLSTLMQAPIKTFPSAKATQLAPVDHLVLSFKSPIDPKVLAKTLTLELKALPGLGKQSRWLNQNDFSIKPLERKQWSDPVEYRIILNQTIAENTQTTVHFQLSADATLDQHFYRYQFSTQQPFRVTHIGCEYQHYVIPAEGVHYAEEQAIACNSRYRTLTLEFNQTLKSVSPIAARNLVRLSPSVDGLTFKTQGKRLTLSGDFLAETLYQVSLQAAKVKDQQGRTVSVPHTSDLFVYFPAQANFIRWKSATGLLERFGPKHFPTKGRGHEKVDVRIHKIDPLDRSFWPFPKTPISVDESKQPPIPGEQPKTFQQSDRNITSQELAQQIHSLGSPALSSLIDLPLKTKGKAYTFGLDLAPLLSQIAAPNAPGAYLVGLRQLSASTQRQWVRLQVTDLSLTTIETERQVRFVVTSLKTGLPVAKATIRLEAAFIARGKWRWKTVTEGQTDGLGQYQWDAPGKPSHQSAYLRRIVVEKGHDSLVLDPNQPPKQYADNHWQPTYSNWLQWTHEPLKRRIETDQMLCHLFTERPMYKPEQAVHIKGYLRSHYQGQLSIPDGQGTLQIDGPDGRRWQQSVEVSQFGSFYYHFDEKDLPSGDYYVSFELQSGNKKRYCGDARFSKEIYQLPKFEVKLHGPDNTPIDTPFKIALAAHYYAGGTVAKRPVRWRVTQFPHTWNPTKRPGFYYSTDGRFSGHGRFQSRPAMEKHAETDALGSAELLIDPSLEPTAQPRRYVIESTVIGDDDQTVTDIKQVLALPPFTLALKTPRYLPAATHIQPQALVVDAQGKPIVGQHVKLRLLHRQWHNHLEAADFSQGKAKYVSDVVDKTVYETEFTSGTEPKTFDLPIQKAGVYIVEIESQDTLGRAQRVSVDLYAGGDEAVTWSQPPADVFQISTDKAKYEPGESATLILQSPFQRARVLAIVEHPDQHNEYTWLDIEQGKATFKLPIKKHYTPRIPVHFVLMRGRVGDNAPNASGIDLGKPTTLAATQWVMVKPTEQRIKVDLTYPKKALPGATIPVDIVLTNHKGQAQAGEVTLWLVDQAVLALAQEARLDPLPDFIINKIRILQLRDTRNSVLGYLPMQEYPGGDAGEAGDLAGLLNHVTVRKNFKPVPFYQPNIMVDASGKTRVHIQLPDNLTNFKIRAKVVSHTDQFGYAKGMLSIRLPVIVQPALPHFVRPGDQFTASAIARVVDGEAGDGIAEFSVTGAKLLAESNTITLPLDAQIATKIPVQVAVPATTSDSHLQFSAAVQRKRDKAQDAFSISIPIYPNHQAFVVRQQQTLKPGDTLTLAPSTKTGYQLQRRQIQLASQPSILNMAASLDYLLSYPYGCTEQRISAARAQIASQRFRHHMGLTDPSAQKALIEETQIWLDNATNDEGLVSYWPGGSGYVALTAWSLQFLTEAKAAGYAVDAALTQKVTRSLTQALRSDSAYLLDQNSYAERIWALTALAQAGVLEPQYATELARKAPFLSLENLSQVIQVLATTDTAAQPWVEKLLTQMMDGFVFKQYQGKTRYAGLQNDSPEHPLLLNSEVRTLAQALSTISHVTPDDTKTQAQLLEALNRLYEPAYAWGNTNANAAAILALTAQLNTPASAPIKVTLDAENSHQQFNLGQDRLITTSLETTQVSQLSVDANAPIQTLTLQTEETFISQQNTQEVKAQTHGFALQRAALLIQDPGIPPIRIDLQQHSTQLDLAVTDIVETHLQVTNPKDRYQVAIVVPLAAGMRVMNPNLATASSTATPNGTLTQTPTFVNFQHHQVEYFYDFLPKGLYHFYFRSQATIPGHYSQPAARVEMMYQPTVFGQSAGAKVVIK